jgi:thymidylate synthase (FAD)
MDNLMAVNRITGLTNQQVMWAALHQDYSDRYVWEEIQEGKLPSDDKCGEIIISSLLKGGRGHFGPLEQWGITVACGYMPHALMQQIRTHRISVTFDCQSMRYTSKGLLSARLNKERLTNYENIEKVIYLRPLGFYTDRNGAKYEYKEEQRREDLEDSMKALTKYHNRVSNLGHSEEHARGQLPFDLRQHFVLSFNNLRSLWHMLDLRWKPDAQLEAQWFCDLLWEATKDAAPALSDWYEGNRKKKARLAP